jgi:protoheme ferro-lyase
MITGASVVGILVSQRSLEPIFAGSAVLGLALSVWGFGSIAASYDRLDALGFALVFSLASGAGGYALASTLLGRLARPDSVVLGPHRELEPKDGPAVVVLSEFEPTNYDTAATAAALDVLAEEGLLRASIGVLPFLFMAQKTRYRAAGGTSPGAREIDRLAERLLPTLRGRVRSVDVAACEGERSLARRVAAAVERGFRTIVVAEAVIADSLEVDKAKRAVDALRLEDLGVTVTYVDPLWGSERCASLVSTRALAVIGDPASAGVVLVGQAQPEERSRLARAFDEQETAFLNRVRMLLIDRGVPDQSVRIAWADWRTPEITGSVRHLAALGCRRIVVLPACYPLDSITTMLDMPLAVRQARVDESVSVVTLSAWHDDPGLIEVLRSRIVSALDTLEVEEGPLG